MWYQSPIRPYDPVIEDVAGGSRYLRDNFSNSGQDSFTIPPAQDQSMWASLLNVMPITTGAIARRWGYNPFATGLLSGTNKLYSFQRDIDGLRLLLSTGGASPQAFTESGASYNASIYSPTVSALVRMVTSRSYAYFFNGYVTDQKKWNGNPSGGVTNIGIDVNNVTSGSTFGPKFPGSATDLADNAHPWVTPSNIEALDGVVSHSTVPAGGVRTNTIRAGAFGLSTTGLQVLGIVASVTVSTNIPTTLSVTLTKDNGLGSPVEYGSTKTLSLTNSSLQTFTLGSQSDLWNGIWTTADTQSTNFGMDLSATAAVANGKVTSVTISNGGQYLSAPTVAFGGGGGSGATGSVSVTQVGQTSFGAPLYGVTGVTILTQGSGYSSAPGVTFYGGVYLNDFATGNANITTSGPTLIFNIDAVQLTVYVIGGAGVVVGSPGSGNINLTVGRIYYEAFKNSLTGHYSDISEASASTGPQTNADIPLTLSQNNDPQVDTNVILATADGGDPSILYLVAEVPSSQTSYTDNTTENELVNSQVLLFTDDFGNETGITDNDPPPPGDLIIKHQGRLWLANGQNLFFSKSVGDLTMPNGFIAGKYEEAWPADNYFDISEGAEQVAGLLSDGTNLYIGTESHIRILTGNDPTNFSLPAIVHPNTGLLNQEVWQLVYLEGSPSGAIWLTPDFRVIGSDFNTYFDIGTSVQDVLNNINQSAAQLCHSFMVTDGEFDLYILAVPIKSSTACDTHLVYDMKHKRWFVWTPNDASTGAVFNISASGQPQWLFANSTNIFQYSSGAAKDNGNVITVQADTPWLHLGAPSTRKVLDDIEIIGDPNLQVSVFGASTYAQFQAFTPIISNIVPVISPFGNFKVYLAAKPCTSRYYKFRFQSNDGAQNILTGYSLRFVPFHTL